jgi:hypothetical protein
MYMRVGRKCALSMALSTAILVAASAASANAAQAGYGPPLPPPGNPLPGGFTCIVTSQLVPDFETKVIGPLRIGDLILTMRIHPYTFTGPVQITVTEPYSPHGSCDGGAAGNFGFRHYKVIGGIGISAGLANEPSYGHLRKSIGLKVNEIRIHNLQSLELAQVTGQHATEVSRRRSRGPFKLALKLATSEWIVLVRHHRARHGGVTARGAAGPAQLSGSRALMAALLPAGLALPGLGVLEPAGIATTMSTAAAAAAR